MVLTQSNLCFRPTKVTNMHPIWRRAMQRRQSLQEQVLLTPLRGRGFTKANTNAHTRRPTSGKSAKVGLGKAHAVENVGARALHSKGSWPDGGFYPRGASPAQRSGCVVAPDQHRRGED